MSSLGAMARGPEQPPDKGGLELVRPPGLPKGACIRNTFLEFHDECSSEDEGDEEASRALRQCSDSLLEMSCSSMRIELEQDRSKGLLAPDTFGRCTAQAAEPEPQPPGEAGESPPLDARNREVAPRVAFVEASHLATGKATPRDAQDETRLPIAGTLASAGVRHDEVDDLGDAPSEARLDSGSEAVADERMAAARELAAQGGGLSGCVTVMVRRIPSKYTQHKLMIEINAAGFLGKYDFFYLLMQPHSHGNRGFAFINFISPESGESFYQAFNGRKLRHFHPEHPLSVLPADLQGFEANAEHYVRMQSACARRPLNGRALFFRTLPGAPAREAGAAGAIQHAPAKISGSGPDAVGASLQRCAPVVDTAQRRICPNCGNSMQASHLFCIYCGTRASSDTSGSIGGAGGGLGQIAPFGR